MSLVRALRLLTTLAALVAPAALFGAAPPATSDPPQGRFLTGQLLVATPDMRDPRFRETVILMVRHSKDGAMGLVINRPAGDQRLSRILQDLGDDGARRDRQRADLSSAARCSRSSASSCTPRTIAVPASSTSPAISR